MKKLMVMPGSNLTTSMKTLHKNESLKLEQIILLVWFALSLTLSPNQLSRILIPPLLQIMYFIVSIFMLVITSKRSTRIKLKLESLTKLFLFGIILYVIGITIAFSFQQYDGAILYLFFSRINILINLVLALVSAQYKDVKNAMNFYSNVMFIWAIFSIILFVLIMFTPIKPLGTYVAVDVENRVYENYIIGLAESTVFAQGIDISFHRVQSFYNEPGNFAMMLMPALLWSSTVTKSTVKNIIFIAALILTFSVGSWFTILPLFALLSFKTSASNRAKNIRTILSILFLSLCLLIFMSSNEESVQLIQLYLNSKLYDPEGEVSDSSSAGLRITEVSRSFNLLFDNPEGLGLNSKERTGGINIGFLQSAIEAGIIGSLGYFFMLFSVLLMIFNSWRNGNKVMISLSTSILSLISMSFQRSDMFSFSSGALICGFFVRTYLDSRIQKVRESIR